MKRLVRLPLLWIVVVAAFSAGCGQSAPADSGKMTFFVTSVQAGDGGNIGGLAGADAHCQKLAEAVGSQNRQWRAYLSASAEGGRAVHARDRIGTGPWFNAQGVQIATGLEDLHGRADNFGSRTVLNERGRPIGYYHDMMTGSNTDGTLASGDVTCRNWTSTSGHAIVGHSNRQGSCCDGLEQSWNSAHLSEGCSVTALQATGGAALFYCFAVD